VASVAEIGANALRLLADRSITSLEDDSERARLVNALWPQARDASLRAHGWRFARKRAQLQLLQAAPLWEYSKAYQLPTNPWCLRVLKTSLDDLDIAWTLEGRTLVTDAETVKILYVARVEDPGEYDASFEAAVTARLAADLAYPVTRSVDLAKDMLKLYGIKVMEARFLDSTESSPQSMRTDDLVTARRTGGPFVPIKVWP
jgi:hypothetical protein